MNSKLLKYRIDCLEKIFCPQHTHPKSTFLKNSFFIYWSCGGFFPLEMKATKDVVSPRNLQSTGYLADRSKRNKRKISARSSSHRVPSSGMWLENTLLIDGLDLIPSVDMHFTIPSTWTTHLHRHNKKFSCQGNMCGHSCRQQVILFCYIIYVVQGHLKSMCVRVSVCVRARTTSIYDLAHCVLMVDLTINFPRLVYHANV